MPSHSKTLAKSTSQAGVLANSKIWKQFNMVLRFFYQPFERLMIKLDAGHQDICIVIEISITKFAYKSDIGQEVNGSRT